MSNPFQVINESNYDDIVFESQRPVIVMFGAKRCSVCKELLPIVEEVAAEYKGKLDFYWLDVDDNKYLAQRTRIRGIPTLVYFKEGSLEGKIGGLQSKENIVEFINKKTCPSSC